MTSQPTEEKTYIVRMLMQKDTKMLKYSIKNVNRCCINTQKSFKETEVTLKHKTLPENKDGKYDQCVYVCVFSQSQ